MSTYKTNIKSKMANKRVKRVHSKAKFVGLLYFLGTLALAVLSCLPTITLGDGKLWVVNFWKPYTTMFGEGRDIYAIVLATLYLFVLLANKHIIFTPTISKKTDFKIRLFYLQ